MKRIVYIILVVLSLLLATACLYSCADDAENEGAELDTPPASSSKNLVLNVYNWGEYISDGAFDTLDSNKAFEEYYYQKFGVKVEVKT